MRLNQIKKMQKKRLGSLEEFFQISRLNYTRLFLLHFSLLFYKESQHVKKQTR